jgi:hypothetical protein
MACEQKRSLLEKYKLTSSLYASFVRKIRRGVGRIEWAAFDELRNIAEDAQHQAQIARGELELHVRDHRC